jgi:hypothetical protein
MLARVYSCALIGLDGQLVEVEVDITRAEMPNTMIVGLPDAAVQEAKERVRAAVRNSGLTWPFNNRIVVNLAPADLRKEGPSYDLPVAVGILAASGQIVGSFDDAVWANCRWTGRCGASTGCCRWSPSPGRTGSCERLCRPPTQPKHRSYRALRFIR